MTEKAISNRCETPLFFADAMLGKLARWMRVLGYDVEYESDIEDGELVRRAVEDDRIVLTRDTLLMKRRKARGRSVLIESDHIGEQLRQVVEKYRIEEDRFLTRCIRCNVTLDGVEKHLVEDKVPPYVYQTQEGFSVCAKCGRVYWAGTHKGKMREEVERFLKRRS